MFNLPDFNLAEPQTRSRSTAEVKGTNLSSKMHRKCEIRKTANENTKNMVIK